MSNKNTIWTRITPNGETCTYIGKILVSIETDKFILYTINNDQIVIPKDYSHIRLMKDGHMTIFNNVENNQ